MKARISTYVGIIRIRFRVGTLYVPSQPAVPASSPVCIFIIARFARLVNAEVWGFRSLRMMKHQSFLGSRVPMKKMPSRFSGTAKEKIMKKFNVVRYKWSG